MAGEGHSPCRTQIQGAVTGLQQAAPAQNQLTATVTAWEALLAELSESKLVIFVFVCLGFFCLWFVFVKT